MSTMIKTLCAGMIAALSSFSNVQAADAAPASPGYIGADIGAVVANGNTSALTRVYGGLTMGSSVAFDLQQVHALELMLFTTRLRDDGFGQYDYCLLYTSPSPRDRG